MTDRELLEYAAKAAGIDLDWDIPEKCKSPWIVDSSTQWNPLTDDADAFRLAVKLMLEIEITEDFVLCCWIEKEGNGLHLTERPNGDPYAATRRAIVRAAAEIGRAATQP